ncbi:hypothetical protein [Frigoribacterium sp. VKM Ac-2836]|uniref:hypothetical protein n=1 Tax=Frigoribacterium sp. VKM Ac-2836 TaxID=2739014 RepID=UPI001566398C|nr:hypothetical protein [Frigoribacterium sp. VKM Ac-2836]NRD25836.1 hypothetical protein [Frigoribacterium sp. VKM Ac-2836]
MSDRLVREGGVTVDYINTTRDLDQLLDRMSTAFAYHHDWPLDQARAAAEDAALAMDGAGVAETTRAISHAMTQAWMDRDD